MRQAASVTRTLTYPRRGLHGEVVHLIGLQIMSGELKPGDPLPPEDELIANLAVSRTVLREAVRVLAAKGLVEAGASLAMSRLQIFRYIVLKPALQRIWPALSSQIVIVMLGSAVVSQIAAEDLTFAANFIQSRNFRAFEVYFIATAIYLLLAVILRQLLRSIGWWIFPRPVRR